MIKTMFVKNKILFLLTILLSFIYSFNGVLISSIINYAGKFNNETSLQTIVIFTIMGLIGWIMVYLANYFCNILQARIIKKNNIFYKSNLIKNNWYSEDNVADSSNLISILMNDFKLIEDSYLKEVFNLIDSILTLLVSLIYMLMLNKVISIIFIIFSFLPLLSPILFNKLLNSATQEWTRQNKLLVGQLKDFFSGLSTFKTYGRRNDIFSLIKLKIINVEDTQLKLVYKQSRAQFIGSIIAGIAFILPFAFGCLLMISSHNLSITTLLAIFLANDRVISPIMNVTSSINEMASTKAIRSKINKYMIFTLMKDNENLNQIRPNTIRKYVVKKIKYKMHNSEITLNCNLIINYNDKILIIGESGVGKSTLLKIINGTVKPNKGSIIGVTDTGKKITNPFYSIAYINQSPYMFSTSIVNNITLFGISNDSKRVNQILSKIGLTSFSKNKLNNIQLEKDGISISGGQKQKIELARALYSNKTLILADEITANLDKKNAEKIRTLLFNMDNPVVEVAHHFNIKDKRYTKIFILNNNGNLERLK